MSEYIVRMPSDMPYEIKAELNAWYVNSEPIVRCKDCKYYEFWEFRDGRTAHDCARGGAYLFDTEPDGFCAWGERNVETE